MEQRLDGLVQIQMRSKETMSMASELLQLLVRKTCQRSTEVRNIGDHPAQRVISDMIAHFTHFVDNDRQVMLKIR